MRITTTTAKVTYILAWVIVGLLGATCWRATTRGALPSTFTNPLIAASCLAAAATSIPVGGSPAMARSRSAQRATAMERTRGTHDLRPCTGDID